MIFFCFLFSFSFFLLVLFYRNRFFVSFFTLAPYLNDFFFLFLFLIFFSISCQCIFQFNSRLNRIRKNQTHYRGGSNHLFHLLYVFGQNYVELYHSVRSSSSVTKSQRKSFLKKAKNINNFLRDHQTRMYYHENNLNMKNHEQNIARRY